MDFIDLDERSTIACDPPSLLTLGAYIRTYIRQPASTGGGPSRAPLAYVFTDLLASGAGAVQEQHLPLLRARAEAR